MYSAWLIKLLNLPLLTAKQKTFSLKKKLSILKSWTYRSPKGKSSYLKRTKERNSFASNKESVKPRCKGRECSSKSWRNNPNRNKSVSKPKRGLKRPSRNIWDSSNSSNLGLRSKGKRESSYLLEEVSILANLERRMRRSKWLLISQLQIWCRSRLNLSFPTSTPARIQGER